MIPSSRLPSLNALRAFRYVATHGSVARASLMMNVSPSSVSRHITTLESDLGCSLFSRTGGLSLTAQGKELFDEVDNAFSGLETVVQRIRHRDAALHVKVVPTIAVRWLLPNMPDMPEILIAPRWKGIEVTEEGFRVGIRHGLGEWPSDCAIKLYDGKLTPVCSPKLAHQLGTVSKASDFTKAKILHSEPNSHDWTIWSEHWSGGVFDVSDGLILDSLDNALRAAEDGLGIAMADTLLAKEDIASGRLVRLSNEEYYSGISYYLVFDKVHRNDRRLNRLLSWVMQQLSHE